jgi:hypothetical protein
VSGQTKKWSMDALALRYPHSSDVLSASTKLEASDVHPLELTVCKIMVRVIVLEEINVFGKEMK